MDVIGCRNECKLLYSEFNIKIQDYNYLLIKFLNNKYMVTSFTISDAFDKIIDNFPLTKMIYVYRGSIKVSTSGNNIDLMKGNMILINAHSRTIINEREKGSIVFAYYFKKSFFNVEFMDKLSEYSTFYNFINYCKMDKNSFHAHLVYECDNYVVRQKLFILMKLISQKEFQFIKSSLLEVFDYLQNSQCNKLIPELSTNVSSSNFYEILKYIYTNYEDINLDSLSAKFNYHRNYLSSMIKKETGMTLSEHIQSVRLERAKNLLCDTNVTVFDIASKIGYTDVSYFNRIFKKMYNVTPKEYRRVYRAYNVCAEPEE